MSVPRAVHVCTCTCMPYMYFLCRLIQDREISLMDGTRLVGRDRYQKAMEASGLTPELMAKQ